MAQVTRANSKLKFQAGDVPTENDFIDLHDSAYFKSDEVIAGVNATGTPSTTTFLRGDNSWAAPSGGSSTPIPISIYQALGTVVIAEPIYSIDKITTSTSLSNQQARLVPVWLATGGTVTGVKWFQNTQGVYTSNNYNGVGLYSYSGGTLTLVASSTDDGTIWQGSSSSWQSKSFTTPYTATAGLYIIVCLYCSSAQTTAPSIGAAASPSQNATTTLDFTNSAKLNMLINTITALPTTRTMATISVTNLPQPYFALY